MKQKNGIALAVSLLIAGQLAMSSSACSMTRAKKKLKKENYIFTLGVNCGNPRQLALLLLVVSLNRVKKNEKIVISIPAVNLVLIVAAPTVSYFNPGS